MLILEKKTIHNKVSTVQVFVQFCTQGLVRYVTYFFYYVIIMKNSYSLKIVETIPSYLGTYILIKLPSRFLSVSFKSTSHWK